MIERTNEHGQRPDVIEFDGPEPPAPPSIGAVLKALRGDRTLRKVETDTGISNSYLSNLEMGRKNPGIKSLSKLATYYQVPLNGLLDCAGMPFDEQAMVHKDILATAQAHVEDIQRSYDFVLGDPVLGDLEKPAETPPLDTQKFVVRLYEHYTGKRLL